MVIFYVIFFLCFIQKTKGTHKYESGDNTNSIQVNIIGVHTTENSDLFFLKINFILPSSEYSFNIQAYFLELKNYRVSLRKNNIEPIKSSLIQIPFLTESPVLNKRKVDNRISYLWSESGFGCNFSLEIIIENCEIDFTLKINQEPLKKRKSLTSTTKLLSEHFQIGSIFVYSLHAEEVLSGRDLDFIKSVYDNRRVLFLDLQKLSKLLLDKPPLSFDSKKIKALACAIFEVSDSIVKICSKALKKFSIKNRVFSNPLWPAFVEKLSSTPCLASEETKNLFLQTLEDFFVNLLGKVFPFGNEKLTVFIQREIAEISSKVETFLVGTKLGPEFGLFLRRLANYRGIYVWEKLVSWISTEFEEISKLSSKTLLLEKVASDVWTRNLISIFVLLPLSGIQNFEIKYFLQTSKIKYLPIVFLRAFIELLQESTLKTTSMPESDIRKIETVFPNQFLVELFIYCLEFFEVEVNKINKGSSKVFKKDPNGFYRKTEMLKRFYGKLYSLTELLISK